MTWKKSLTILFSLLCINLYALTAAEQAFPNDDDFSFGSDNGKTNPTQSNVETPKENKASEPTKVDNTKLATSPKPEKELDEADTILQAAQATEATTKNPKTEGVDDLWNSLEDSKNKTTPTPAPTPLPLAKAVMPTPEPTPLPPTFQVELNSQKLEIYLKGPWETPVKDRFLRAFVMFFNGAKAEKEAADPKDLDRYIVSPHIIVLVKEKHQVLIIDPATGTVFSNTMTGINKTTGEPQYDASVSTRDPSVWRILNEP